MASDIFQTKSKSDLRKLPNGLNFKSSSASIHSNSSATTVSGRFFVLIQSIETEKFFAIFGFHFRDFFPEGSSTSSKPPNYLIAVHRKCVRQEAYFLSQQKSKPSLFGVPLLLGCGPRSTCQSMYETVWAQVTRLLSPLPQSDQTNHATDWLVSVAPFRRRILKLLWFQRRLFEIRVPVYVKSGLARRPDMRVVPLDAVLQRLHLALFRRPPVRLLQRGAEHHEDSGRLGSYGLAFEVSSVGISLVFLATGSKTVKISLFRYQSNREKVWLEDESVQVCRKLHTEPIDLDYCLKAFTSEERLEAKYHCSNCQDKQPATKKLQIWRLPPILVRNE